MQTNATNANTNEREQPATTNDAPRTEEQFWIDWWREYAQTWK